MAIDWLSIDLPSRRGIIFGMSFATAAYCFFPKWAPIKYHYDYTTMEHGRVAYTNLRRNTIMIGGAAIAGSLFAAFTRNPKFD